MYSMWEKQIVIIVTLLLYNNDNKFGAFRPTLIYSLDNSDSLYCFPFFV